MKRILVTGVNGFIGKYVVKAMLEKGYRIVGIGRSNICKVSHKYYEYISGDICDSKKVKDIFEKYTDIEGIIHLAAVIDMQGSEEMIRTNCMGAYILATEAKKRVLKFFINISSIPVIGKPKEIPINEEHKVCPMTPYHASKLAAEEIIQSICQCVMKVFHLRISSPIGVGMKDNVFLARILQKCKENSDITLYGKGLRIQNYIDVRDITQAIINCVISKSVSGIYLIGGKQSISNIELAELCIRCTQSFSEIIFCEKKDIEEKNQWIIDGRKAKEKLSFEARYSLAESILWINESMK